MIQSIYFEILKSLGKKKHLILLSGFLFLCVIIEIIFFKTKQDMLEPLSRELKRNIMMAMLVPDPSKVADGMMYAGIVSYPLFFVLLPIFSFTMAGETFATEAHDGTLKAYLSRGFSRKKIVFAKLITILVTNIFYSFVFSALALLIGIILFGLSKTQLSIQLGHGSPVELIDLSLMLKHYFLAAGWFGIAITAVSIVPFILSSMINRSAAASAGGMVFYFISFVVGSLPFDLKTDVIAPFLETKMMAVYSTFYAETIDWSLLGEALSMMALYGAIGIMIPMLALQIKEY